MSADIGVYAVRYAELDLAVLPLHHIRADGECSCGALICKSAGKHPMGLLVPNGLANASRDVDTIQR